MTEFPIEGTEIAYNKRRLMEEKRNAKLIKFRDLHKNGMSELNVWLDSLRKKKLNTMLLFRDNEDNTRLTILIYTCDNVYEIAARTPRMKEGHPIDNGYLGCSVSNRKPSAGDDCVNGKIELSGGEFVFDTWLDILYDILEYELEEIEV